MLVFNTYAALQRSMVQICVCVQSLDKSVAPAGFDEGFQQGRKEAKQSATPPHMYEAWKPSEATVLWEDDDQVLPEHYMYLGASYKHYRYTTSLRIRKEMLESIDPEKFTPVHLNTLNERQVDALLFFLTGLQPDLHMKHFENVTTKGELREAVKGQCKFYMNQWPGRRVMIANMASLSEALPVSQRRYGYPAEFC